MLILPPVVRVYLASRPVDMRCGHDGLMAIVKNIWAYDPYSGHLFAFVGKRRDRLKLLYFDRNGFVLVCKRLETGRFKLPAVTASAQTVELDGASLAMLLDGIDVSRVTRPAAWPAPSIKERIDRRSST